MKGFVKCIIAGAVIIGIGIVILLIALGLNGWSFAPDFETENFVSEEENHSLSVNLNAGKLRLEYYDGDEYKISYPTAKGYETTITEKDGKLSIDGNKHKWYIFTWGITIPETVVQVPENMLTEISITVNAGSVEIPDSALENVQITVNAGACNIGKITDCKSMKINLNAGAMTVNGVSGYSLTCDVNAGAANINSINCTETEVDVSAGSTNLSFAGEKSNYTATVVVSAGKCDGLATQLGGNRNIRIKVSAGNCNVSFAG